jgi:16S rRNA (adenine1518-N6/adenine1519-N6)-dimethyltransferase
MSIEETKQLLRTHRITPNKLSGQNFMIEPSFYSKLSVYALLEKSDAILDAGAGFGFLSRFLANKCKAVIAVEKDPKVAEVLREQIEGTRNVTVIEGDVLKAQLPEFNKVITIPPYYLSSRLITWLFERRIDCAVLILQKEFASRLVAAIGSEDYGWLTVMAYQHDEVEILDPIPKTMFYPPPRVDSIIVRLKPRSQKPIEVKDEIFFKQMLKWLFTQRNKKAGNALASFIRANLKLNRVDAEKLALTLPNHENRVRELSPKDFGAILNAIHS